MIIAALIASLFTGVGVIAAWLTGSKQPVAMGLAVGALTMAYYFVYAKGGF